MDSAGCADLDPAAGTNRLCVSISHGADTLAGYPALDEVVYADLDADGTPETVIPIDSGGAAGIIGFAVYRADVPRPRLVALQSGYKLRLQVASDVLVASEPWYLAADADCCPTTLMRTPYVLRGDQLTRGPVVWSRVVDGGEQPVAAPEVAVLSLYSALAAGRPSDAYSLFSPGYQALHSFEAWSLINGALRPIEVQTQPGPRESEVLTTVVVEDLVPTEESPIRSLHLRWTLIRSAENAVGWLLDFGERMQAP